MELKQFRAILPAKKTVTGTKGNIVELGAAGEKYRKRNLAISGRPIGSETIERRGRGDTGICNDDDRCCGHCIKFTNKRTAAERTGDEGNFFIYLKRYVQQTV